MNPRSSLPNNRASKRPQVVLWLVVVGLALLVSGCCGSCCRSILGDPGGGGPSGTGTGSGGISNAPNAGSVASMIAQNVGPFRLEGTAPVTRLGSSLQPGVVDSIGAVYRGPGGEKVNQIVLAYASSSVASARMDRVYQVIAVECPGKRLLRRDIRNRNGVTIGKQVVCDRSPQHVYWSNGRILTFVTAPHPRALEFYNASSY